MGELFHSFIYTMLGDVGRYLIAAYYQHEMLLLGIIAGYALLLFYARCILLFYYPYKMKQVLLGMSESHDIEQIRAAWLEKKATLPFFIVVPSRNELWVRRASKSPIEHGLSFFRDKKSHATDYEQLDDIQQSLAKK